MEILEEVMIKKEKELACIDFDGVLLNPNDIPEGKRMGNPMPGARESLLEIKKLGYKIVVFTVRGAEKNKGHVEDWLKFYEMPFDEVTNIKQKAAFYIDDLGLSFVDWPSMIEQVRKVKSL